PEPAPELRGLRGILLAVAIESLLPVRHELLAAIDRRCPHVLADRLGDEEMLVRVPAVGDLREPNLFLAERLAVGLLAVLSVWGAVADVGSDGDQARAGIAEGGLDGGLDRRDVRPLGCTVGVGG